MFVGVVTNVFEAVDVITLIKDTNYDNLNLNVGEALQKRQEVCSPHFKSTACIDKVAGLPRNLHMLYR